MKKKHGKVIFEGAPGPVKEGDHVRVGPGSGMETGKTGVVVPSIGFVNEHGFPTIPTTMQRPFNAWKDAFVQFEDGHVSLLPKSRLLRIVEPAMIPRGALPPHLRVPHPQPLHAAANLTRMAREILAQQWSEESKVLLPGQPPMERHILRTQVGEYVVGRFAKSAFWTIDFIPAGQSPMNYRSIGRAKNLDDGKKKVEKHLEHQIMLRVASEGDPAKKLSSILKTCETKVQNRGNVADIYSHMVELARMAKKVTASDSPDPIAAKAAEVVEASMKKVVLKMADLRVEYQRFLKEVSPSIKALDK